ncbi:MAG: carbon storage regulator CsrA [Gammaproteobacteria bacterium]|nr:carbon storage regulator CsrA [Gammaproteobacteria bacterium]
MLVLTRRAGESVMIDGHIEIKVLRIRGNQVHLGIDAPTETLVHRHEVWARLQQDAGPAPKDAAPADAVEPDVAEPAHPSRSGVCAAATDDPSRS